MRGGPDPTKKLDWRTAIKATDITTQTIHPSNIAYTQELKKRVFSWQKKHANSFCSNNRIPAGPSVSPTDETSAQNRTVYHPRHLFNDTFTIIFSKSTAFFGENV